MSEPPLPELDAAELESLIEGVRERMRPLEQQLAAIRQELELLLTERRRRERLAERERRAGLKESIRGGQLLSLADLVASADEGSFDDYRYNLKTGGEVRLGFPGARAQTISWTDGARLAQARDWADCARFYAEGWEMGSPGRPGVRVHFPGTRLERLVPAADVFCSAT